MVAFSSPSARRFLPYGLGRVSKDENLQNLESTNRDPNSHSGPGARTSLRRALAILAAIVFGVFYMMLAVGGASFVHECQTVVCGQLHQAVFGAIGAMALFASAYRLV